VDVGEDGCHDLPPNLVPLRMREFRVSGSSVFWWVERSGIIQNTVGRERGRDLVAERSGRSGVKVKYASAHDFRRAFGSRWANRVMPVILQQLMRHASISTTMEFYVGRNAEAAAEVLWEALGNTSGNTELQSPGH